MDGKGGGSTHSLLNLPESPLLCMGMNGSPERGGGTEGQVVGFKEALPFGRGASFRGVFMHYFQF